MMNGTGKMFQSLFHQIVTHRVRYLTEIKETVMELQAKLSAIISDYEHKGFPYDAEDVVRDFSNPNFCGWHCFFYA